MGSLRKFDLLTKVQVQDGWVVEIRRRLQGRAAGQLYKCFKSPNGEQFWTAYLVIECLVTTFYFAITLGFGIVYGDLYILMGTQNSRDVDFTA